MKKIILLILCCIATCTAINADDSKDALKVYQEYLNATSAKNLGTVMSLLDKTSPNYPNEIKAVAESMINSNLTFKIISAKTVGKNTDILVLRITQQNIPSKDAPETAQAVEIEALQIFKMGEDGKWKFRNSVILSGKTIDK